MNTRRLLDLEKRTGLLLDGRCACLPSGVVGAWYAWREGDAKPLGWDSPCYCPICGGAQPVTRIMEHVVPAAESQSH